MQTKPFSLKVLSSRDYIKLADKYPNRVRRKILTSRGFTDLNRNMAFIKNKRDKTEMAGTAFHELLHLVGEHISEREECRLLFKGEGQPTIQAIDPKLTPEQQDYYTNIYKPYQTSQFNLYKDVGEPSSRQLGGILQSQLTQPFTLPEDIWNKTWQTSRERALMPFDTASRQMSQRFASMGALENSGQVNKAFQNLDYQKQKSIETQAIEQAIAEWTEKKQARQQSIANMMSYLAGMPTFNMQLPSEMYQTVQGEGSNWITGLPEGTAGGTASDLMFARNQDEAMKLFLTGMTMGMGG